MRQTSLRIHLPYLLQHAIFHYQSLLAGGKLLAERAATDRRVIVQPEVVPVIPGAQQSRQTGSVGGDQRKGLLRMHAAVKIRRPGAGVIHTEHLRILRKQLAREQLPHRMQLMLHRNAVLAAGGGEGTPFLRLQEAQDLGGSDMCADGIDAVAGGDADPVDLRQFLGGQH